MSDNVLYKHYCQIRNLIQGKVKLAKQEYFMNKVQEHRNYSKKLWGHLKPLGFSHKKQREIPKYQINN